MRVLIVCLFFCLFVCLFVCLSGCLFVCLCVCVFGVLLGARNADLESLFADLGSLLGVSFGS